MKVVPNWIHLHKHKGEDRRWYCRLWLEYSGAKLHSAELAALDRQIQDVNERHARAVTSLQSIRQRSSLSHRCAQDCAVEQDLLEQQLSILDHEEFQMNEIGAVVRALGCSE